MLIAAKPTPKVMPMKYLPSRVSLQLARRPEPAAQLAPDGSWADRGVLQRALRLRVMWRDARVPRQPPQSGTGTRATTSRTAASASSRVGHVAFGVGGEADAVREQRHGEVVDVVRDAVVPAVQQRAGAGGARQVHAGAGRGAEGEGRRGARGRDQRLQVGAERAVDRDPVDLALQRHERLRIEHDRDVLDAVVLGFEHQARLDVGRRIADADAHHEAVELRFGQRERAGEVLRILRGDHEERLGKRDRLAVDRDLAVVHRLEQARTGCAGWRG